MVLGTRSGWLTPSRIFIITTTTCLTFLLLANIRQLPEKAAGLAGKSYHKQHEPISFLDDRAYESNIKPFEPYPKVPDTMRSIQNNTLGFEKLIVLNLPERTDKRDAIALAASLTNMSLTFSQGVKGESVVNKSLPFGQEHRRLKESQIGSWRGHLNIMRSIVENGWSSALVLEDDADWDINLKSQLIEYAHGSRFLQNQSLEQSTHSPYGDGWDILWLGHCHDTIDDQDSRSYRFENDPTVPANKKMRFNNHDFLAQWPEHSRIVHVIGKPICTFAYAVSYQGAQKMLYGLSVDKLRGIFDNALSWWCTDKVQGARCLSVHPPYFAQHKVKTKTSKNSDINSNAGGVDKSYTINIRYSTKLNIEQLLTGSTDYHDSYPRPKLTEAEGT